jgi:EAL domain-containing protein (putative c-di-GMP-specific phosphodiesterase class I)/GGDEF domain-containing protein
MPEPIYQELDDVISLAPLARSSDQRLLHLSQLGAELLAAPIAIVVVRHQGQLKVHVAHGCASSESDLGSFATHVLDQPRMTTIGNVLDHEYLASLSPVRHPPGIRSLAGSGLYSADGRELGAFIVFDTKARQFSDRERDIVEYLTRIVESELTDRNAAAHQSKRIRDYVVLDPVTQLPKETFLTAEINKFIKANRAGTVLLCLIRLNRFEPFHSAVGKPGTAHLIRKAVYRLKDALNTRCHIGLARDDTISVACAINDSEDPRLLLGRLLQCFDVPFTLGEHTLAQGVSIGTAMYPRDASSPGSLLKRARTALHAIPKSDVSRYRQYDGTLSAAAVRHFEIETALQEAIEHDELELVFQPKIDIRTGSYIGAEALLRWNTPKLGIVGPSEFIPIAEECGLIVQIGDWALTAACKQIAKWKREGYNCREISVNVSGKQLPNPRFCERVRFLLDRYALDGSNLNLEITEGTLIENISEALDVMSNLRQLGLRFSIDDFGKGFSSLSYLAQMPVQALKLDRSFIERIANEQVVFTLVRSVIAMAHALDLKVIAEGVERQEQLRILRELACDYVQGFLVSPPLSSRDFQRENLSMHHQ